MTLPSPVSRPATHARIAALSLSLRRRQLIGSRTVAIEVVKLLKEVVGGATISSFEALMEHVENVGKGLQDAGPKELVITNMTRRILKFLEEEYATALAKFLADSSSSTPHTPHSIPPTPMLGGGADSFPFALDRRNSALGSMFDLLGHKSSDAPKLGPLGVPSSSGFTTPRSPASTSPSSPASPSSLQRPHLPLRTPSVVQPAVTSMLADEFSRRSGALKPVFLEAIQELMDEVEMTYRSVAEQSIDHIHSGEFILTLGHSSTVLAFLRAASRKRKFTVIVAETAPSFSGRTTALELSAAGISTILIPDSNIFSLLPRCSKVLLGPHLVLADGALLSIAGSLPLCVAASQMRVPVVVVGGMFKFSPEYLGESDWSMRDLGNPGEVLEDERTEVLNPYYDVVPAALVSLYITNLGGHPSSLLYRLLSDMYGST